MQPQITHCRQGRSEWVQAPVNLPPPQKGWTGLKSLHSIEKAVSCRVAWAGLKQLVYKSTESDLTTKTKSHAVVGRRRPPGYGNLYHLPPSPPPSLVRRYWHKLPSCRYRNKSYHTADNTTGITLQAITLQEVGIFFLEHYAISKQNIWKKLSDIFIYYLTTPSIFETMSSTIT